MEHTAIGVFQGDPGWSISVRAGGFSSKEAAERYANSFRICLIDGKLYRDHADGYSPEDKPWIEVADGEVSLSRLKPEVRNRISQAHCNYHEQGLDPDSESIRVFEKTGKHDLVISDGDYERVDLPISQWHIELGLTCDFGSLAYSVE